MIRISRRRSRRHLRAIALGHDLRRARAIDAIFVDEWDEEINPLGIQGVGEIGIVGTAAAIANAVYHATGKRVRDLPMTLDKLLGAARP